MTEALPLETFDGGFQGQDLETTYFDTRDFALRKARNRGSKYLTLRIRCYQSSDTYALSAKTEDAKYRVVLDSQTPGFLLHGNIIPRFPALLPAGLLSRPPPLS